MIAAGTQSDRDVIPRWRPFGDTVRSGETAALRHSNRGPKKGTGLLEQESSFLAFPGLTTASDFVGSALVASERSEAAIGAARYLVERPWAGRNSVAMAEALLREPTSRDPFTASGLVETYGARIKRLSRLRVIVRSEPRNAVRWVDLALAHTGLGQKEKAAREISIALAVGPSSRFVIRAAVRLYVHLDQPDRAHALLVADPTVLEDPWLAAAELSTSSLIGKTSRFTRNASFLISKRDAYAPIHTAELASQLATDELRSGRRRHARRLMELALRDPTDNALAQAEWASANGLNINLRSFDVPHSFEAKALRFSHEGDWDSAASSGLDWLTDQPFASEPADFASYAACVGAADFILAEHVCKEGLVANPSNHMLRNNLAFALGNQNRVEEASVEFHRIPAGLLTTTHQAILTATGGLIEFRAGRPDAGRKLYEEAVASLFGAGETALAAMGIVLLAREEVIARTEPSTLAFRRALDVGRAVSPEVTLWIDRLVDEVGRIGNTTF